MGYDLILRNATVVDGSGGDAYGASIAVRDGSLQSSATTLWPQQSVSGRSTVTVKP